MSSSQPTETAGNSPSSHLPGLSLAEWIVFALLAALMAAVNIYSTLLIGWGDTGSIIAVLASVLFLGAMGRRADIQALNLGQTLVSAGGSVGFAVASYAAVKMVDPSFDPNPVVLGLMFVGMALIGTIVGASVRRYMVRYYFPSGTACAVIAKSVSQMDESEDSKRPVRMLARWGGLAALIALPMKVTFHKVVDFTTCAADAADKLKCAVQNGASVLPSKMGFGSVKGTALGLSFDPLLFGIGIVVGPRIGLGMIIGSTAPILMAYGLESGGIPAADHGLWVRWMAIAVLTLPTFASILFAYLFRTPPVIPAGFAPGSVTHRVPQARNIVYSVIGLVGVLITAICAQVIFEMSFVMVIATVAISWPLCVINGRVTGDTDINPVRLVAIVLLSLFAMLISESAVVLLGIAIIGGTLAGMAVDMMQDYRTGYLVDANPSHQTTVQFVGAVVGALAAIPFFLLIEAKMGFGAGTSLPAPGATVWKTVAESFTGAEPLPTSLWVMVAVASLGFSALAFFTVWPLSARFMPSIFGIGIGLLLSFDMCLAIFLGGMIKWVVTKAYSRGKSGGQANEALRLANNDTLLVGASIFAAGAVVSILVLAGTELLRVLGIDFVYMAGGH